jgi:hypothetical protein
MEDTGLDPGLIKRHSQVARTVCDDWLYGSSSVKLTKDEQILTPKSTSGYSDTNASPEDTVRRKKSRFTDTVGSHKSIFTSLQKNSRPDRPCNRKLMREL